MTPYTGNLSRGDAPDRIIGHLRDVFGFVLRISGTRKTDGSYDLTATVEIPQGYRIAGMDE